MPESGPASRVLHKLLEYGDLPFRDFVEVALYHPEVGYYTQRQTPIGREADYITSPALSPVFAFAIGNLVREFVASAGGALCTFVDIGCGDGTLLRDLSQRVDAPVRWWGVDRSLDRASDVAGVQFVRDLLDVPRDGAHLIFSNELFDALPFARLVMRGHELHELWVHETESGLDWVEHEAAEAYDDYFASHAVELEDGQFADVSLDWSAAYRDIVSFSEQALVVTFDYGYAARQLFHRRARRFGTAAAYAQHRVTRDLLSDPGGQDLTAHINFDDLIRTGEEAGCETLFFDRQAKFLLTLDIAEDPLLQPIADAPDTLLSALQLREMREDARRLVMPDGIGEDIRVLVQGRGIANHKWSFQRKLF